MPTWRKADGHYSLVGVTPGWHLERVIDLDTLEELDGVVEVNTAIGWVRRHVVGPDGVPELEGHNGSLSIKVEKVMGRFRLERLVED